ncbi:MAG: putative quinol monooxygenase [Pseudomonadota bacterium]
MFAVTVTFQIASDQFPRFLELTINNAQTSLRNEPGCQQFDVATDPARPNEVFLYEVYDDADAFDTHLASDHFHAYDGAVADLIKMKTVVTYSVVRQ